MPGPLDCLKATALSVVLAVALAEAYELVAAATGLGAWLAAAVLHTVLAAGFVVYLARTRQLNRLSVRAPLKFYAPALIVGLGAAALAVASRLASPGATAAGYATPLAWVVWIPPVEELVFRGGVSLALRRLVPWPWAGWFAALTFALVHANPTVGHILSGQLGLPLGPFLLGLACEALVGLSGRLLPGIALHVACNATVAIFGALDARWLDWLGILYT